VKTITPLALTSSSVRACVPASWPSVTGAASLEAQTLSTGHKAAHRETSVFGMKQILGGSAMKRNGYGFGNPVDVNAQRVRVAAGTPPRSRPV
jgi:hypothetical protein